MRKIGWKEIRRKKYHVIHGKVYDLHEFKYEHPGGKEILDNHAGMDCTEAFDAIRHSEMAQNMMKKFCIGELTSEVETSSDNVIERPVTVNDMRRKALLTIFSSIYIMIFIYYYLG